MKKIYKIILIIEIILLLGFGLGYLYYEGKYTENNSNNICETNEEFNLTEINPSLSDNSQLNGFGQKKEDLNS